MSVETIDDVLTYYANGISTGKITSLAPMLSLLSYEGKPLTLRVHFQLEPLFRIKVPRRTVYKTARQVGKSMSVTCNLILSSCMIPNFHNLLVQPQYTQMKQISTVMFKPLVDQSFIKDLIKDRDCPDSERLRAFKNGSRVHFGYCGTGAGRLRGLSNISRLVCDETQDMDPDEMNIVAETMSASEYGIYQYTGTPKTTDNYLSVLYDKSSQGVIVITCEGCNKENIANLEHDLERMIGKKTCICAKCGKPLDPRLSKFIFARPELRNTFDGFHISQITHPLHCRSVEKWNELLYKIETYPPAQVKNEIFGEACDEAIKMITRADLKAASHGGANTLDAARERAKNCSTVITGVDWGGGGIDMESFTVIAILGHIPRDNQLEVLYIERIPYGRTATEEAERVIALAALFQSSLIAHDATGAGRLREELLIQAAEGQRLLVVPFSYVWAPRQDVIKYHESRPGFRSYYSLDKTRSLTMTVAAIKAKKILLPDYNTCPAILDDFLALAEDIRDDRAGSQVRIIVRTGTQPDDAAHAINLGANANWYVNRCLPSLGHLTRDFQPITE